MIIKILKDSGNLRKNDVVECDDVIGNRYIEKGLAKEAKDSEYKKKPCKGCGDDKPCEDCK